MKTNKKTTILLFGVVILSIVFVGFYWFSFNALKKQTQEATAGSVALQEYRAQEENIALVEKIIEETKKGNAELDNYFINEDGVVGFIERIESIADTAGVAITLSGLQGGPKNTLVFTVGAEGSFRDIMHFVSLMEYLPLPIDTKRAFLSKRDSSDPLVPAGGWAGSFSFELSGYMGK